MLRAIVALGNVIEGTLGLIMAATAAWALVTLGWQPMTFLLLLYAVALVLLHAASAYYAAA